MREIFDHHKKHNTDVLVIGAGAAGLRAAIESENNGVNTMVITKDKLPFNPFSAKEKLASTLTSFRAGGGIQAAYQETDSIELHFEDTIKAGGFVNNQGLVKMLTSRALNRLKDLEKYGTKFRKDKNGNPVLSQPGGTSTPRTFWVAKHSYQGGFMAGLVNAVKNQNIKFLANTIISSLFTHQQRVVGALGINLKTEKIHVIEANSIILATGGAGQLFPLTTQPSGATGDGYILALDAGAELVDMEFIQWRVCALYPKTVRGFPPPPYDGLIYNQGGRYYNRLGERYMKKYDSEKEERVTRDKIAIRAYREIMEGKGTAHGGVYNDLSGVDEEVLESYPFIQACREGGIDPSWQPVEWAPGAHHFMGGIRINSRCETNIKGLYAAGEVTGGVHGANRLAGNALTDTQVFGALAGEAAAEFARKKTTGKKISREEIEAKKKVLTNLCLKGRELDSEKIRKEVKNIMNENVGVIRSQSNLRKAINELDEIEEKISSIRAVNGEAQHLREIIELNNLVKLGKLIAKCCLKRTESRGSHYREDFPKERSEWVKNIIVTQYPQKEVNLKVIPPQVLK